ncbi:PREDICTED: uncharacterized protein LOC106745989 [Dinoponera quadriceps]|uniref:Uncharacterized protein LOC106745989 n=1 Tax=Dinoponera quadriceps TaxID=609295 RepID=A0A6P3XHU3_DINQU|nr:PREDICTED: uncharacterized protein LOC106745989 [Dinoponera quadriceps]
MRNLFQYPEVGLPRLITCNRREPPKKIERCLKLSIESMKQYLGKENTNLDIPSFEPYYSEYYQFISRKVFNGTADLTDITVQNLRNFTINKVEVDANVSRIKLEAFFPLIKFRAIYDIDATILGKYLRKEERTVMGNFTGVSINATIEGEYRVKPKNNEEYFKVNKVPVELSMNEATIYLNNKRIFDPLLQEINSLLNSNRKVIAEEIIPKLQTVASKIIRRIAIKMFSNIPIRILMPSLNVSDDQDDELSTDG